MLESVVPFPRDGQFVSRLAVSKPQAGCAHAGEAAWTLADGRRTSSGAGKQLGARIVLGGGQFLGAHKRVEIDCSVGSNTLAAAPQPALCSSTLVYEYQYY